MNLRVAIALAYYKRPKIVLNALQSIKELDYDNWHLFFIDDSGDTSFKDTLDNFGLPKEKYSYLPIMESDETKIKQGGSRHGEFINKAFYENGFDIGITLCDDDALFKDYLSNLNRFYSHTNEVWGYCHVKFYNPEKEHYSQASPTCVDPSFNTSLLNLYTDRIAPSCKVDSSQVSFRLDAFKHLGIKYPFPRNRDLDRSVFEQLQVYLGSSCPFIGCYGQYKGWFKNQLGFRHWATKNDFAGGTSWEEEYLAWIDLNKK